MLATDTAALVALLQHSKRPWTAYAEEVEAAGARAVAAQELGLLGNWLVAHAQEQVDRWGERGFHVLTAFDPGYPENLRTVHDRPPLIFVAGSLRPKDARSVALIGSREASPAGVRDAQLITAALVEQSFTVVSGLARGIDTVAHIGALERGGRTIAVIGTGLERCYPAENAALQREIELRGAVVSRFWPGSAVSRQSFPLRNAVMSGLALANVIVEASPISGTRVQARLALAHGRPVLLMDRLLAHDWARELAQRAGVHIVRSAAEVIDTVERLAATGTLVD